MRIPVSRLHFRENSVRAQGSTGLTHRRDHHARAFEKTQTVLRLHKVYTKSTVQESTNRLQQVHSRKGGFSSQLSQLTLILLQEADKYKQYNAGHVPDLIKPGDSAWGTDWLGESKVPSPLRASAPPPGCRRMGHTHGFGSTEEPLRRTVFGCRERGLPSGPRFDHTTGEGHVPFHKGDYHDALRHKNNQVALLLVECFGGIASGGARLLRYLARRASDKKRGRDGTKYSKFHPRGYLSHHLAAISMAAVYTDAAHIADGVIGLKQRSLAANDPTE